MRSVGGARSAVAGTTDAAEETHGRQAAMGVGHGYYLENLLPHFSFGWAGLRGYRDGSRKLIRSARVELYDLASDPSENVDMGGSPGTAQPVPNPAPTGSA